MYHNRREKSVLHLCDAGDELNQTLQLNPYVVTSDICPWGTDV